MDFLMMCMATSPFQNDRNPCVVVQTRIQFVLEPFLTLSVSITPSRIPFGSIWCWTSNASMMALKIVYIQSLNSGDSSRGNWIHPIWVQVELVGKKQAKTLYSLMKNYWNQTLKIGQRLTSLHYLKTTRKSEQYVTERSRNTENG